MNTNFESTISAKAVGTADIDKQAEAMRRLADSIDGLGKKADRVNEHPGFAVFAEKVKAGIQDPLGTAGDVAEGFLKKLGPMGVGSAAAGAALLAVGAAGMSFARDLGHAGDQVEDTASRLGVTTTEAQQFSYAMKLAGGDVASLEGVMRKLSAEVEGGGENLNKLGVRFRDVNTGAVLPIVNVIADLVGRLKEMPSVTERTAAAISVLGKGAAESLPDLLEFPEKLRKAQQDAPIFSGAELAAFNKLHQEMVRIDAQWDYMVAKLKQGVTIPLAWIWSFDGKTGRPLPNGAQLEQNSAGAIWGGPPTPSGAPSAPASAFQIPGQSARIAANDAAVAAARGATDEERLADARQRLKDDLAKLATGVMPAVNTETLKKIATDRADIAGIEAKIKATKDLEAAMKELATSMAALNSFDTLGGKRQTRTEQLAGLIDPFGAYGQNFGLAERLKLAEELRQSMDTLNSSDGGGVTKFESSADRTRRLTNPFGMYGAAGGAAETIEAQKAAREAAVRSLQMESGLTERLVELRAGPGGELAAAQQIAQIREDSLRRELAVTGDVATYREESRRNEIEYELRLAGLQRQRVESMRAEFGGIFDGLTGGKDGIAQFSLGQLKNLGRAAFSNTATSLATGGKISAASTFGGTWLGDMLGSKNDPSMKLNSAGDHLTMAAGALMDAARAQSVSASGGGGGFSAASASMIARYRGGYADMLDGDNNSTTIDNSSGFFPQDTSGGGWNFAKTAGVLGAGAGAGFGIYSGIKRGSGVGALTAASSAVAGAGAVISLVSKSLSSIAGPVGLIAGTVLGSVLPMLIGDPKAKRAEEMDRERQNRAYTMPTGAAYEVDIYGRGYDRDYRGGMRPIVVNIHAVDGPSVEAMLVRNPDAVSRAVTNAVYNDNGQMAAAFSQVQG